MRRLATLLSGLLLATLPLSVQAAPPRNDQDSVRKGLREGQVLSLDEILRRVLPKMRGMQYLGPEYDAAAMVYRLKFLDKGRVVFLDIDARSGEVIRQR